MMELIEKNSKTYFEDWGEDVETYYEIVVDGVEIGSAIVKEFGEDGTALLERLDIDEDFRCKGFGTAAIEMIKENRSDKDGALYCAAENARCARLYARIGCEVTCDPWVELGVGFGVFCLG